MKDLHFSTTILLLTLFFSASCFPQATGKSSVTQINRETLEIIIGGGSSRPSPSPGYEDCPECTPTPQPECPPPPPPPPPPECPPPPPPPSPPPPSPPPPSPPPPSPPPPSPPPPRPPSPRKPPSPPLIPIPLELKTAIQVIQRFKNRIDPDGDPKGITKTWVGNDICKDRTKYIGFICNTSPTDGKVRVAGVKFNEYNFCGKSLNLNGFIAELKDLVIFHVNSNNFTGTVPSNIAKLPTLYELDLSNNKLSGAFPGAVLGATNLTYLDLRFNGLSGQVPPQAFTLDLDVLFLNNNYFNGEIPGNIGLSPVLFLTLANNKFTGPIPKSIGQASDSLREVLFLNNQLSGCLPYEIGLLKLATVFDVSKNMLTGPIPHSFGCLAKMQQLNLAYNHFYGEVPEILCKLGEGDLFKLTLTSNYFTQVGPECRKLIERKVLDVSMNCILDLPSQRSAAECKIFFLKQPSCPDKESYNYIPCHIDQSTSKKRSDRIPKRAAAPSPSYAALIQNR